ncbi:hypothetical protein ACVFI8_12790 [Agarivorans sp. MS3-6]|uniref:hypothetical protein n=1 Tax=Agarivorans sp. TSD2052 TaxID=2937286 RepID=UPI00200EB1B3|nr:hypothetical protein [Agarivorans sp. TSD2052]UPW18157.1 hypothetical protein M0C34_18320 [Agarivorans sp. TSD2052]
MKQCLLISVLMAWLASSMAFASSISEQELGEVLIESRKQLYQDPPEQNYTRLIAFGLDTRYGVFVRSWLYFEIDMATQQLSRQVENEHAKARHEILLKLRRQIDLE